MNFQRDHSIKASGVLDAKTLLKMDKVLGKALGSKDAHSLFLSVLRCYIKLLNTATLRIFAGTDEDKVYSSFRKTFTMKKDSDQ